MRYEMYNDDTIWPRNVAEIFFPMRNIAIDAEGNLYYCSLPRAEGRQIDTAEIIERMRSENIPEHEIQTLLNHYPKDPVSSQASSALCEELVRAATLKSLAERTFSTARDALFLPS